MMKKEKGKILIAGGSGLIGSILKTYLEEKDKEVYVLSRSANESESYIRWSPTEEFVEDKIKFLHFEALINASGADIAEKRWTKSRKNELIDSRLIPVRFLWSLIRSGRLKTDRYIQISAIGIYGQRKEPVNEYDPIGDPKDFMVRLVRDWEEAFLENSVDTISHCILRLGVVISAKGGFIARFLDPIRFFISPYFGDGKNYVSWIHEQDLAALVFLLTEKKDIKPVYNLTTSHPFTSQAFSKELQNTFQPYALRIPVPRWALKILFGEMSAAILSDAKIMPSNLEKMGYDFIVPQLPGALQLVKEEINKR